MDVDVTRNRPLKVGRWGGEGKYVTRIRIANGAPAGASAYRRDLEDRGAPVDKRKKLARKGDTDQETLV